MFTIFGLFDCMRLFTCLLFHPHGKTHTNTDVLQTTATKATTIVLLLVACFACCYFYLLEFVKHEKALEARI